MKNTNPSNSFAVNGLGNSTPSIERTCDELRSEEEIERAISNAAANLASASTVEDKKAFWRQLRDLHALRTKNMVRFMERIRGLA